jgi:hypothetical protein
MQAWGLLGVVRTHVSCEFGRDLNGCAVGAWSGGSGDGAGDCDEAQQDEDVAVPQGSYSSRFSIAEQHEHAAGKTT